MTGLPAVDDTVAAAVDAALSSLLADKDVSEVGAVEGGLIEVMRRGRRERLPTLLEGPLFALLRERGDLPYVACLAGGVRIVVAALVDGRLALSVAKPAPTDARLEHLVEEGVLPAGVDGELVAAVLEGGGVGVLGPARSARARIVVAVVRTLSPLLRMVSLSPEVPTGCLPSPVGVDLAARAQTALLLGADVLVSLDLSAADACALAKAGLPVPVLAAVRVSSMAALQAAFALHGDISVRSVFALSAVVGLAPDGRPRLVELHGAAAEPVAPAAIAPASQPLSPSLATHEERHRDVMRSEPAPPRRGERMMATSTIDVLPALADAPPADWASSDANDDPGWELGPLSTEAPTPGSFEAALQVAAQKAGTTPRPASAHPQALSMGQQTFSSTPSLKGTGGLTLEPPGGASDDGED